jgi:hypothetical protein
MIDLTNALNCIAAQKNNHTYGGARIGMISYNVRCLSHYRPGEVVLFTPEMSPSDLELQTRDCHGRKQEPNGRVTLEKPLSLERIAEERAKGSLITTMCTCINVPAGYIEEIKI